MLRSWFRDQVLHPHETQHTVEEVLPWIKAAGLEPRTTSVNEFRPVTDWNAIYETERTFRELSYRKTWWTSSTTRASSSCSRSARARESDMSQVTAELVAPLSPNARERRYASGADLPFPAGPPSLPTRCVSSASGIRRRRSSR